MFDNGLDATTIAELLLLAGLAAAALIFALPLLRRNGPIRHDPKRRGAADAPMTPDVGAAAHGDRADAGKRGGGFWASLGDGDFGGGGGGDGGGGGGD